MTAQVSFDFKEYVTGKRRLIESRLDEYLSLVDPAQLWESMRYSVLSGGKRLRALLCLAAFESISADEVEKVLPCACAIELVHAMSLIHDDLPALDNDDLRRGHPTNHKVYGEAMAILAGDALLALAFEVLMKRTQVDSEVLLSVAVKLSQAVGAQGMVGGQVVDMSLTGTQTDGATLELMHRRKTGALIAFSSWSGGRLAGAGQKELRALSEFGEILGLAFQVTDDLLDVTGNTQELGKTPGKDAKDDKTTWVRCFGIEQSRLKLRDLKQQGQEVLHQSGIKSPGFWALESLLDYAVNRGN